MNLDTSMGACPIAERFLTPGRPRDWDYIRAQIKEVDVGSRFRG
jgi:hypothetical protein